MRRWTANGAELPSFELFVSFLLDGITGFLAAPVSEATRHRLHASETTTREGLRLL